MNKGIRRVPYEFGHSENEYAIRARGCRKGGVDNRRTTEIRCISPSRAGRVCKGLIEAHPLRYLYSFRFTDRSVY